MSQHKIAANFLIQTSAKAISVVLGLGMTVLLTRALQDANGGTALFGEYTTVIAFLQLFGVVVDLGLTLTLPAMLAECKNKEAEERLVGTAFWTRLFSSAVLFGCAPLLALAINDWSSTVHSAVVVGAIAYTFMSGATVLIGVFQKYQQIWRASLAEVLSRIVLVVLTGIGVILGWQVIPFVAILIAANVVWLGLTLWFMRPIMTIRFGWSWFVCKAILARSWPIALSICFNLIYLKTDILFLSMFRSAEEVGLYGLAYRFLDVVTNIPVMYMGILLPALAADWTRKAFTDVHKHIRITASLFWIISVPLMVGTLLLSGPVLRLIGGEAYVPAAPMLQLLILAVPALFLGGLFGHVIVALNKQRQMISRYGLVALMTVCGYLVFIPIYGAFGAAMMTLFSEFLVAFLAYRVISGTTHVPLAWKIACKTGIASLAMAGVIYGTLHVGFFTAVIAGSFTYLSCLWGMRVFSEELISSVIPERLQWKRKRLAVL